MTTSTSTSSLGLGGASGRLSEIYTSATQSLLARNPGIKTIAAQLQRDDARLSTLGKMALALDGFRTAAGSLSAAGLDMAAAKSEVKAARDPAAIGAKVKDFVAAFNTMTGKLAALRSGDAGADTALNQVTAQIGQLLGGADQKALAGMGITRKNGGLALDEARLKAAIAADPERVLEMFTKSGSGLAEQLAKRAGQQVARGGAVANQAVAVKQDVDKLIARKEQISDAVTRQAAMMAQQYALAGNGQVKPMSLLDYLA